MVFDLGFAVGNKSVFDLLFSTVDTAIFVQRFFKAIITTCMPKIQTMSDLDIQGPDWKVCILCNIFHVQELTQFQFEPHSWQ